MPIFSNNRNTIQSLTIGFAAMGFIALLVFMPLIALLRHAESFDFLILLSNSYIQNVIKFSLYQAFLSTLISLALAIPLAFSIARQSSFWGRQSLIRLLSLSLIIPTVVAVYGIVGIFGHQGVLLEILKRFGIESDFSLYGLNGILIAHVFFNLPLSTRILLQSIESIAPQQWRLASQLGITSFNSFKIIQWPVIKKSLPGIIILVFSLCFTSFAIIMTLGGGPAATTIEVAIYQALRFEFDINQATGLAFIQIIICLTLILISLKIGKSTYQTNSYDSKYIRQDGHELYSKLFDFLLITLALAFIASPLLAIVLFGLSDKLLLILQSLSFLEAALSTLLVSVLASILSVSLALALLNSSITLRTQLHLYLPGKLVELSGSIILIIPPLVLGTGLFLSLRNHINIFNAALPLTIVINALMGLPFAIRILESPLAQAAADHDRLCTALGISGIDKLKVISWPVLRKPISLALAFTSTLAAGDLTVIALFGSAEIKTLPLLLYQLMGSYRLEQAAAAALVLLVYCLCLFWLIERFIGGSKKEAHHARTH